MGQEGGTSGPALVSLLPGTRAQRDLASCGAGGSSPAPGSLQAPLLKACPQLPLTEALPSQQRQRARRRARWSPSSGSSSNSSWEDSEPEEAPKDVPEEAPAGGPEPPPAQYPVPDMDLWVPARQSTEELRGAVAGGCPRPPEGPDTAQATAPAPTGQLASRSRSADPRTVGCLCPATAHRWSSKGLLGKVGSGCSTPLPGGHRGCAQWRQRPGCGAEASPLHVTAPAPGPFPESCPGQLLTPWRPAPSVSPACSLSLFFFFAPFTACGILVPRS